jgi:hypothetical protein
VRCTLELGSILPIAGVDLPPGAVEGLRQLFGRSVAGAEALLDLLEAGGPLTLPDGVTVDVLLQYRELAVEAIASGKDILGVQALRVEAIDLILRLLGHQ